MKKFIVPIVSVVALVVGLISLFSAGSSTPTTAPNAGAGVVNNSGNQFVTGTDMGSLPVNVNWTGGKILAKSNQAYFRNTTGGTLYIDYVEVSTDGTASSTFKIYAATSTASSITNDFTAPYASIINGYTIATSSTATSTTNSSKPLGFQTVQLADGKYLNLQLQAAGPGCLSTGGICESATSTNRGFNLQWRVRYHN